MWYGIVVVPGAYATNTSRCIQPDFLTPCIASFDVLLGMCSHKVCPSTQHIQMQRHNSRISLSWYAWALVNIDVPIYK